MDWLGAHMPLGATKISLKTWNCLHNSIFPWHRWGREYSATSPRVPLAMPPTKIEINNVRNVFTESLVISRIRSKQEPGHPSILHLFTARRNHYMTERIQDKRSSRQKNYVKSKSRTKRKNTRSRVFTIELTRSGKPTRRKFLNSVLGSPLDVVACKIQDGSIMVTKNMFLWDDHNAIMIHYIRYILHCNPIITQSFIARI